MLVVVVADVVPVAASVLIVALVLRNWQEEVPDKIENLPHKLAHSRLIDEEALSLLHNLGPKQELTRKWKLDKLHLIYPKFEYPLSEQNTVISTFSFHRITHTRTHKHTNTYSVLSIQQHEMHKM